MFATILLALSLLASCDRPDEVRTAGPYAATELTPERQDRAVAIVEGFPGSPVSGELHFLATDGGTVVEVALTGLKPGSHGLHVHEFADCSRVGAAGAHFAPDGAEHGPRDHGHAGDLGNVTADAAGRATTEFKLDSLTLEGSHSLVGRSVIVHAGEDDLVSQPSGGSGEPIACGVIVRAF